MKKFHIIVVLLSVCAPLQLCGSLASFLSEQINAYLTPLAHQTLRFNALIAPLHFVGFGVASQLIKKHTTKELHQLKYVGPLFSAVGGAFTAIAPAYSVLRSFPIQTNSSSRLLVSLARRGAIAGVLAYQTGRLAAHAYTDLLPAIHVQKS